MIVFEGKERWIYFYSEMIHFGARYQTELLWILLYYINHL